MTLTLSVTGDHQLISELDEALTTAGLAPRSPARMRTLPGAAEIIVALGSAGAFTALYQIISKLLERHKDREIKIERAGCSISLKAHGFTEEKELLKLLAPELLPTHSSPNEKTSSEC